MKIIDYQLGDLKGTLYKYGEGYKYKIRYKKEIIAQQYTYMLKKEECYDKMLKEMENIIGFNKTLFDLEKL